MVVNRGEKYRCRPGQSLLASMELANSSCINIGCRGGGCGVCKVRILSGEYSCKRMSKTHIAEDQAEAGFALACRVMPLSDLTVESDHCSERPHRNTQFYSDSPATTVGNNPSNNKSQRKFK
nr:2Fe-2S iron-sulfur cluster binding domain-containing protein [Pseudomaricurvus alcaniphilus]